MEKEMATHSGILAWEIPWTEKPGGYNSWGHGSMIMLQEGESYPGPESGLLSNTQKLIV